MTKNILILNAIFYLIISFLIWKNKILILSKHLLIRIINIYTISICTISMPLSIPHLDKTIALASILILVFSIFSIREIFNNSFFRKHKDSFAKENYYLILNTNKNEIDKILKSKSEKANVKPLFLNKVLFQFDNSYDLDVKEMYLAYNQITAKPNLALYLYLCLSLAYIFLFFIF